MTNKTNNNQITTAREEVKCAYCHSAFHRALPQQIFCSPACRKAAINARNRNESVTKSCVICHQPFSTPYPNKVCCGPACARERHYQQVRLIPHQRNGAKIKCKGCGIEFTKEHQNQLYCTKQCQRRLRVAMLYPPTKCVVCGQMFEPKRRDAQTCGLSCRAKRDALFALKMRVLHHHTLNSMFGDDEGEIV